jgi:hypothetical protein
MSLSQLWWNWLKASSYLSSTLMYVRALCIIDYLDQQMHNYINSNVYFLKYSDVFRCIYITFRQSFSYIC